MKRSPISVANACEEPLSKEQSITSPCDEISKTHRIQNYLLSLPERTTSKVNVPSIENDAVFSSNTTSSDISSVSSDGTLENAIASEFYGRICTVASERFENRCDDVLKTDEFKNVVFRICHLKIDKLLSGRQTPFNNSSRRSMDGIEDSICQEAKKAVKRLSNNENSSTTPTLNKRSKRTPLAVTPSTSMTYSPSIKVIIF